MSCGNKTHIVLLVLYGLIVFLAVGGLASQVHEPSRLPVAIWAVIGTVGACGAMLEILLHLRTRRALIEMKEQIRKLSQSAEVGLVMLEDQWPVEGLSGILNEYLVLIRRRMDDLARERKELDLLVAAMGTEKQNTEAIVRDIFDAVLVVDSFGELALANSRAESLFGFDLAQSRGKPVDEVLSDPSLRERLDPARWRDRTPMTFEQEFIPPGQASPRIFMVTVSPVFTGNNELWAVALILHDVTQERELARMKTDFVNHVSHELRTPLSSIKAYVELLIDGEIRTEAGRMDFYRIIQTEADRLDRFIENMLNLGRIESGLMAGTFSEMALGAELGQAAELVRPLAREKAIELETQLPAEDLHVRADRDLLRQVVLNLLSNAVKYTPSGGRVTLSAGADAEGEGYWIAVKDTGVGITPEERERIFDKFYRGGRGTDVSGGTGLGLALVKKVVEQVHGGIIEVISVPGQGSTFTLRLPGKPAISPPPAAEECLSV